MKKEMVMYTVLKVTGNQFFYEMWLTWNEEIFEEDIFEKFIFVILPYNCKIQISLQQTISFIKVIGKAKDTLVKLPRSIPFTTASTCSLISLSPLSSSGWLLVVTFFFICIGSLISEPHNSSTISTRFSIWFSPSSSDDVKEQFGSKSESSELSMSL